MANTTSKPENSEPTLLKIGIPLALSAAGGVCCGIMMARSSLPSLSPFKSISKLIKNENFDSQNHSAPLPLKQKETSPNIEEVLLGLKNRVEDLERKELGIEKQFIWYQNLKEKEALLMELKNTLVLDMAHIRFLEKEILLMEEENKRFESLVTEYLGVSEQFEGQKPENRLLEREVKKLKKRLKEQSKMIREKNLKIEESRTEFWRNNEEMERKKRMIEKLRNELRELKMQMENNASSSSSFKIEEEKEVTMKDVSKLSTGNHEQEQEQQEQKENHKDLDQKETSPDKTTRPKLTNVNKLSIGNHEQEQQEQQEQKENHKDLAQKESSSDKTKYTRPRLLRRISDSGSSEMNPKMKKKIRPQ